MRALALALLTLPFTASAFCGFYVSGAGAKLFNDASTVVLVRDGTRTVLSMQNNYRGPVEDFAMVVPVPVVLAKDAVKTLPRAAFKRIDELSSPRLVAMPKDACRSLGLGGLGLRGSGSGTGTGTGSLGVTVEAKFSVEEYDVVILSAKFSAGLETWLKANKYQVPDGAAALLQPYIHSGSKFFVARVDAKKAKFVDGQLVLSPLRFHYDAEAFSLPVRLGLLNNDGTQDLIVHILAKDRYELANRENVFVPTNLDVSERAHAQFGGFYKELLARTFKQHPRAAVTEFAWQGALPPPQRFVGGGVYGVTCDPCPPARPVDDPLARYLGVDLLPRVKTDGEVAAFAGAATLTRLHLRYTKDSAPDDLVFKVAPPVQGGVPDVKGVVPAKTNRFQGRYLTWVSGCAASTLANSPGAQTNALELIDAFEQVITSEVRELGIAPAPLPKNPKPLPPAPPPTPPDDEGITYVTAPPFELETPTVSGALAPELVKRVVHANGGQLRYCFELQLAKNPQLAGRVEFSFDINPGGQVMRSALVSSTLADPAATDCMLSRVRTFTFPKPRDNGMVTAKIVATFRAR